MLERDYQAKLIRRLKELFPGCVILKNDANYIQGFPDLLILYENHWAVLEVKRSIDAPLRPNQYHYISQLANMSYSSIIYPENEEDVLSELQMFFIGE